MYTDRQRKLFIFYELTRGLNACCLGKAKWAISYLISSSRWWECVALPDDVDRCNEVSFRMEIRDLAYTVCFFLVCEKILLSATSGYCMFLRKFLRLSIFLKVNL